MSKKDNAAYSHESHKAFNERMAPGLAARSRDTGGSWLSNEAATNLPRVRRSFDLNRDPYIRRQLLEEVVSETQRQQGRGSAMVKQDKPLPAPHPPSPMRQATERQVFQGRWLAEQRDAAMKRAARPKSTPSPQRELARATKEPSR